MNEYREGKIRFQFDGIHLCNFVAPLVIAMLGCELQNLGLDECRMQLNNSDSDSCNLTPYC
jgi:hypothetical protein